ncbi:MAG: CRISPR-associated endonuclease Cas2 [Patescibacteria group bacterium]
MKAVQTAGMLSLALVAPNVIKSMKQLGLIPKSRQGEYVASSASKLAKRGLLKFQNGRYEITPIGEKVLRKWELEDYILPKNKKWDKKWRIIIFDIPEKKRKIRNQITDLFRQAGLYRLQDSVWVFPYDCEDIIGLLKTDFGVGREVIYVIADSIENDKHLRNEFGLS